ncbi:MAG TPA: DUF433 domain-containing protein [Dehalococcoidia bacterium]
MRQDRQPFYGAIRSRVVARLAGVTLRQLQYWHQTGLITAHTVPGARGYPRLYSWVDYMKVRAARKLLREGLHTRQIRAHIEYLEESVPDWHMMPLHGYAGKVLIELEHRVMTANHPPQLAFPYLFELLWELREEGPLGAMQRYSHSIDMHPAVASGNPVIKGTRIETSFLASLVARQVPAEEIAAAYGIPQDTVESALAFVREVA